MDRKLLFKIIAVVVMSILLLVPLALIEGQIRDRSQRQHEVQQNIANSSAGAQTLVGPVILLEFRERVEEPTRDPASGKITGTVSRIATQRRLIAAESLDIDGAARVENRHRGIYQARLFHLDLATTRRSW